MVLPQGMFGYGRLVREPLACVCMLLQMHFKLTCSLTSIHLSAGVWQVHGTLWMTFACFSVGRGCLTLEQSGLEHCADVEVPTHLPDALTYPTYLKEVGEWVSCHASSEAWLQRRNK